MLQVRERFRGVVATLTQRLRETRESVVGHLLGATAILLAALLAIDALLEPPPGDLRSGEPAALQAPAALVAEAPRQTWQPQPMPGERAPLPRLAGEPPLGAEAASIEPLESALGLPPVGGMPYRSALPQGAPPPAPLSPEGEVAALPTGPADQRVSAVPFPDPAAAEAPAWRRHAVAVLPADGRPRIAVVLDDLGPAWGNSLRAASLPGPLTLALLPYAEGLPELAGRARQAGHELLVHMPMEPIDLARNNPGPGALLTSLTPAELQARLTANLGSFEGYVGINNHMGSAFSTYAPGLELVMAELKARGLLFLDSRTVGGTLAEGAALDAGVPALGRDVFLDNSPDDPTAIWAQLRLTEQIARKRGFAVAIGHPHAATLEALAAWLPELEARGFQLVPVSALAVDPGAAAGLFARAVGQ